MDTFTLKTFSEFVEKRYHLNFDEKNERQLIFAIQMRCEALGKSPVEYLQFIKINKQEEQLFVNQITIGETYFFRYRNIFEHLKSVLLAQHDKKTQFKILHIGCATGEEPYSMAMVLDQLNISPARGKIHAVDVDSIAIDKAKKGIYRPLRLRYLTPSERSKYFYNKQDDWLIVNSLKEYVTFHTMNLFHLHTSFIKQKYDIIFCMNVMIYLSAADIENAIRLLIDMSTNDTLVFVAPTDPILAMNKYFQLHTKLHFHWYTLKQQSIANDVEKNVGKNAPISFNVGKQHSSVPQTNLFAKSQQVNHTPLPHRKDGLLQAQQAYNDKDFTTAIELYTQQINVHPAQSYLGLGQIYADQGKILLAAKHLDFALLYDQSNYRIYLLLGVVYIEMNDLPQAKHYLSIAQKKCPDCPEVRSFLTFLENQ